MLILFEKEVNNVLLLHRPKSYITHHTLPHTKDTVPENHIQLTAPSTSFLNGKYQLASKFSIVTTSTVKPKLLADFLLRSEPPQGTNQERNIKGLV